MCHGTENASWLEHKSPGSFPETLGFTELAATGGDHLQQLGICMPCALEGLQPLKPQPEPTTRNQVLFFFFLLCSRTQQTLYNSPIFFFPPNVSKAQGPNLVLLRTGLSFFHRGAWRNWMRPGSAKSMPKQTPIELHRAAVSVFKSLFKGGRCSEIFDDMSSTSGYL